MQRHAQSTPIYTDRSKSASGVGCAAVFPDFELFVSLPLMASIFTAELCAIFLALTRISELDDSSFTIYSDSRSALQALEKLYTRHPLVLKIQRFLAGLHSRRKDISLCWVPSHVGLPGNERADRVAKRASLLPPSGALSLPLQDLYPSVTRALRESWQARWDTCRAAGNKLALIKPTIDRWSTSTHRTRHREVVLARLRIGHTRLTHGHLMSRSDPPHCPHCHVPLSVVHLLVDCPRYASLRRSLFPSLLSHHPSQRLSLVLAESASFN